MVTESLARTHKHLEVRNQSIALTRAVCVVTTNYLKEMVDSLIFSVKWYSDGEQLMIDH